MKDRFQEPEEPPEGGGWCLLIAAGGGVGVAVFAYSRDVFVILVWIIGAVALYRAARKVPGTPNPAPPPPPERGSGEEPQVNPTLVKDPTHPNRWAVTEQSPWLDWGPDDTEDRDVS